MVYFQFYKHCSKHKGLLFLWSKFIFSSIDVIFSIRSIILFASTLDTRYFYFIYEYALLLTTTKCFVCTNQSHNIALKHQCQKQDGVIITIYFRGCLNSARLKFIQHIISQNTVIQAKYKPFINVWNITFVNSTI